MTKRFSRDKVVDTSLRHSVKDGAFFSIMTGSGESYFTAFAVYLKATTAQVGFLASVPPLLASFAQLLSAWLGQKTGRRKTIILGGAIAQAFVWVPLALLPLWFPDYAIWLLISSVVFYYATGNLIAPQWSSMMGDLVHERKRGRYFALRTRIASASSFIALIAAGLILDFYTRQDATLTGYLIIFTIAFIARLISVYHLFRMYDPPGHVAAMELAVDESLLSWIKHSPFARFSLFFALIQLSVSIASPFFSVYLLRDLHFSYMEFMACTAVAVLAQFLTLNYWGRISDLIGNRVILVFCGSLITLLPLLWLFSSSLYYLLLIQTLSGLIWAGFTLSVGNFLYELIPVNKRATVLAFHNVAASIGVFTGALLGGYLGSVMPQDWSFAGIEFHLHSALYNIFLISFVMRLSVALYFLPTIKEVRKVKRHRALRLIYRINRFNPLTGLIFDIVGSRRKVLSEDEVVSK